MIDTSQMGDNDFVLTARVVSVVQKTRRDNTVIQNAYQANLADVQMERPPTVAPGQVPQRGVSFWSQDQQGIPLPGFQTLQQAAGQPTRVRMAGYVQQQTNFGRTTTYWNGQQAEVADGSWQPQQGQVQQGQPTVNGQPMAPVVQQPAPVYNDADKAYFDIVDALPVGRSQLREAKWALSMILETYIRPMVEKGEFDPSKEALPDWIAGKSIELITIARTLGVEMAGRDIAQRDHEREQAEQQQAPQQAAQPAPQGGGDWGAPASVGAPSQEGGF